MVKCQHDNSLGLGGIHQADGASVSRLLINRALKLPNISSRFCSYFLRDSISRFPADIHFNNAQHVCFQQMPEMNTRQLEEYPGTQISIPEWQRRVKPWQEMRRVLIAQLLAG